MIDFSEMFPVVKDFDFETLQERKYYRKRDGSYAGSAHGAIKFPDMKNKGFSDEIKSLIVRIEGPPKEHYYVFYDPWSEVIKHVSTIYEDTPHLFALSKEEGGFGNDIEYAQEFYLRACHTYIMGIDEFQHGIISPCWGLVPKQKNEEFKRMTDMENPPSKTLKGNEQPDYSEPVREIDKRIEELFKEWRGLQPLKPKDQERLDEKIRLDWNFHSHHIEGNTLTYGETVALILEGKEEGIHPERDYMEIKAHDLAIEKIKEFVADKNRKITEADIRNLNQIILKEPFWKEAETPDGQKTQKEIIPGQYKKQPNHVRTETGEIFKFAEPLEVPAKMKELVEWFNAEISKMPLPPFDKQTISVHTLKTVETRRTTGAVVRRRRRSAKESNVGVATPSAVKDLILPITSFLAELHHRFICIHPFDDGNGRIARLWMNYVLMRLGYPPMVIKSEDKRNYFAALQKADNGDMDTFATYLGDVLVFWLEKGINAAKGGDIEDADDLDKRIILFKRNKDFEEIKPLSKEIVQELHDTLFIPVFETLESEFRQFTDFFFSGHNISFKAGTLSPNKDWKRILKTFVVGWGKGSSNTIEMSISYKQYKIIKPFDMAVRLSLVLHEFIYRMSIGAQVHSGGINRVFGEEKPYSRILSNSEIRDFIKKGKEDFFNQLQKEVERIEQQ